MFSLALDSLFVCLLAGLLKNYSTHFTKFDGTVVRGPHKKPLDYGDQ